MKIRHIGLIGAALAAVFLAAWVSANQKNDQAEVALKAAIKTEVVDGDLRSAIEQYKKIVALLGAGRATVATALLRMGQCHEKLGDADTQEARKAYERIVREFADQPEEARLAGARLAALGGRDGAMRVRQVWAGPVNDLFGPAPTRDGRYLTFQEKSENLAVRELATGQTRRLTNKPKESLEFASFSEPSPDGKQVAYSWYNAAGFVDLRIVGMDGSNPRVLFADSELKGEVFASDWSPDGRNVLAVLYRKDSRQILLVSALDGSVRVLKSSNKEKSPDRARFSPDGRYIAYGFTAPGSTAHDIALLDVDGKRETPVVQHPANDVLFDWTPDGKRILFGSDRSGTMGAWWIPIADGRPTGTPDLVKPDLGQDVRPMGFTRDGSFYYQVRTPMTDVYIAEVDFASGRVPAPPILATDRYVGSNSHPAWSTDGRELVFLSKRGPGDEYSSRKAICVRSTDSGNVREIASGLERVDGVHWFPDGRSLLAGAQNPGGGWGAFRIDAQSGTFERIDLARPYTLAWQPAWSADGKTLFYLRWGPAKTSLMVAHDLATGQERELHSVTEPSVYHSGVMLSPDSRQLAVVVRDSEGRHQSLTLVPAAGGEAREVLRITQLAFPVSIAWVPDGQGLLFVKQPEARDSKTELWLVPLQGGEPRKLDLSAPNIRHVRVHPDGRRIALTSGVDRSEVWVMENFLPAAK